MGLLLGVGGGWSVINGGLIIGILRYMGSIVNVSIFLFSGQCVVHQTTLHLKFCRKKDTVTRWIPGRLAASCKSS